MVEMMGVSFTTFKTWLKGKYYGGLPFLTYCKRDILTSGRYKHKVQSDRKYRVYSIYDITTGMIKPKEWNPEVIKMELIRENLLKEECHYCGYNRRRLDNYQIPLMLINTNEIPNDFRLSGLKFSCYNCYYLNFGDIFTYDKEEYLDLHPRGILDKSKAVEQLQDAEITNVDNYHLERLKQMGIDISEEDLKADKKSDDDPYDLVSYKK